MVFKTAASVATTVDTLMATARAYDIEYKGFFSNHTSWLVVPSARCGVSAETITERLAWYNSRLEKVDPQAPITTDLNTAVNLENTGYQQLLAFFDARLAEEVAKQKDTRSAIDTVVSEHLPRISHGCIGAAFHPILELGAGVEGLSTHLTANGLAYMTTRCWGSQDTATIKYSESADLLTPLSQWCADTLSEEGQKNLRDVLSGAVEGVKWEIGAFQKRMLWCLKNLETLQQHSVVMPTDAPAENASKAELMQHYGLDGAVLLASAAVVASKNEFFVVHGLTSLWAVRAIIQNTPSLPHAQRCELVSSWARGYFCAFAAQLLPGANEMLPGFAFLSNNDVQGFVAHYGKGGEEGADAWETLAEDAAERYWKEEHILKPVWMLREMAGELPEAVRPVLFAAAKHLVNYVPEDAGDNGAYFPKENTLRFAKVQL